VEEQVAAAASAIPQDLGVVALPSEGDATAHEGPAAVGGDGVDAGRPRAWASGVLSNYAAPHHSDLYRKSPVTMQ
jgi:hypothetical protein